MSYRTIIWIWSDKYFLDFLIYIKSILKNKLKCAILCIIMMYNTYYAFYMHFNNPIEFFYKFYNNCCQFINNATL